MSDSTKHWSDDQIITDAHEAAELAVNCGIFSTFTVAKDEGPYYGNITLALEGMIYGDQQQEAVEPWAADVEHVAAEHMELWVREWRNELFNIGCSVLDGDYIR